MLGQAEIIRGDKVILTDAESYCAFARFFDANGRTCNQVDKSSDPASEHNLAIRVTLCRCGNSSNEPFRDGTHVRPTTAIGSDQ